MWWRNRPRWESRWNLKEAGSRKRRIPWRAPSCRWGKGCACNLAADSAAMTLEQVLHGVPLRGKLSEDSRGVEVRGLEYDSRRVESGFLFFAFPGSRADGREFAKSAIDRGAVAVASELPSPTGFQGA